MPRPLRPATVRNAILTAGLLAMAALLWAQRPIPLPPVYDELQLHIAGMHCKLYCPLRVTAALEGRAGIYELAADVEHGTVRVRFDASVWTPASISAAVREHLRPPYALLGRDRVRHVRTT